MSHPVHTDFQPAIPKTRSFSEAVRAELEQICARYPKREAALLPALRLLEREFGMVDPPGMIHVADLLGVSPAKVFGVFSFYTHYRRPTDGQYVFQVCSTLSCAMGGSEGITDHLCHKLGIPVGGTTADGMFSVKKVECLANCDQAPTLQVNDDFVDRVTPADCDRMIAEARAAGPAFPAAKDYHPVGYRPPAQVYHLPEHAAKGKGMLLNHALEAGSDTLAHYRARGGYETARALYQSERPPEEIIDLVLQAGLRGRGGAGFPTGQKWKFLAKNDKPRYLVINADESEPGTFKDKMLIDRDPHQLLEGILVSAYALRSQTSYIYIRGEFPEGFRTLARAIDDAYAAGFLGANAFETGKRIDITVHRGAGAYICGEETGLLSSLEGGRGHPKIKPPFPAVEGLFRCPTIVNNVETICAVTHIVKHGPQWFRQWGTEKSPGTKIFSISGDVVRPGCYEIPLGMPLKDFIYDVCGGIPGGKKLKAVIPGGSSAPVLSADEVLRAENPICLDFDSLAANGSMLGSGAIIVIDETRSMVDGLWNLLRFYAHESCGQCTPCREGTGWISKIAGRFARGGATADEVDLLDEVAWGMVGRTICVLADAAALPTRSFVKKFRKEFEDAVTAPPRPKAAGHQEH